MPTPNLLTPPTEMPLSRDDAKRHLRVDGAEEDTLIDMLIGMATEEAEHRTNRALITQSWRVSFDRFPWGRGNQALVLPRPPLQTVSHIRYLDRDGVRQTLLPDMYECIPDELLGQVIPAVGLSWPICCERLGAVQVDYICGYGSAADVPKSIKGWMLLAIGTWYENREAVQVGRSLTVLPREFWQGLLDAHYVP